MNRAAALAASRAPFGEICNAGVCQLGCAADQTSCGEQCVDTARDGAHCGACGNVCAAGEVCDGAGQCTLSCQATLTDCSGSCVDTSADRNNCGACGQSCDAGEICDGNGQCALSCQDGLVSCGDGCVDPASNPQYCGASDDCQGVNAGATCPSGQACVDGSCELLARTKIVFVSSVTHDANFGGLAGADAFCQGLADAAALPGTYMAWLSDDSGSPSSRFAQSSEAYVLVDGTVVAHDWADLTDGDLQHPINVSELNGAAPAGFHRRVRHDGARVEQHHRSRRHVLGRSRLHRLDGRLEPARNDVGILRRDRRLLECGLRRRLVHLGLGALLLRTVMVSWAEAVVDLERDYVRERVRGMLFGKSTAPVRLGRFEIGDKIGSGAMGTVYRAYDPTLERDVALKVLRRDALTNETSLLREARAMARVTHPNVATVHEVSEAEGGMFIAMELVSGPTLREWLAEKQPYGEKLRVLLEAGRGLSAAHERGIVHRDFKPENVLVGSDGRPRVVDFGLVAGTARYMAPEQLRGELADTLSDQFNYCATAFEALYGKAPFAGDTIAERLQAPAIRPVSGDALHPLIVRGLSEEPTARFRTMAALLDALVREDRRRRRRRSALKAGGLLLPLLVSGALLYSEQNDPDTVEGYLEVSELVQRGQFDECVSATYKYPPALEMLKMRIECARAADDFATVEKACDELAPKVKKRELPSVCSPDHKILRDLRQAGEHQRCVEVGLKSTPTLLHIVEMYKCAGELRDPPTIRRVCRFAAKHFPDVHNPESCKPFKVE